MEIKNEKIAMTVKEIMEQAKDGSITWEDIKKREGLDTEMEKLEKMVRKLEDDTISRQATITEFKNYERDSTAPIDYVKIVEQMPPAQQYARYINANELIKRLQQAGLDDAVSIVVKMAGHERLKHVPSAQPERKISNKEWIDFLVFQFDISRTSAKEMLHGMMRWKKEDNFKKQFRGEQDE